MKGTKAKKAILLILLVCSIFLMLVSIVSSYLGISAQEKTELNSTVAINPEFQSSLVYITDMTVNPILNYGIDETLANHRDVYGIGEKIEIIIQISDDAISIKDFNLCFKFGDGPERQITEVNDRISEGYVIARYTIQEGDNGALQFTYLNATVMAYYQDSITLALPQVINKNNIIADTKRPTMTTRDSSEGKFKQFDTISTIIEFSEDIYTIENNVIKDINRLGELAEVYFKQENNEYVKGLNAVEVRVINGSNGKNALVVEYRVDEGDNGEFNVKLPGLCDIAGNRYTDKGDTYVSVASAIADTIAPKIQKIKLYSSNDIKYYTKNGNNYIGHAKVDYERTGNDGKQWTNNDVYAFANKGDTIKVEIFFDEPVKYEFNLIAGLATNTDMMFTKHQVTNNNSIIWEREIKDSDGGIERELVLKLYQCAVDEAGNLPNLEGWKKTVTNNGKTEQVDELNTNITLDTIIPTVTFKDTIYNDSGDPKYNRSSKYYYGKNATLRFTATWREYVIPTAATNQIPLKAYIDNVLMTTKSFTTSDHKTFSQSISANYNGEISVEYDKNIVTDLAGNANEASGRKVYKNNYVDTTKPTISVAETARDDTSVTYTFTMNDGAEAFQSGVKAGSFTSTDGIVVTNGEIMEYTLDGNRNIKTIKVLPSMDGKQRVYVKAGAFTDNVLNQNTPSNVCTVNIDTIPPEIVFAESTNQYDFKGETVKIGTTVTVFDSPGVGKIEYAWSQSPMREPTQWTQTQNSKFIEKDVNEEGTWYLWIQVTDTTGKVYHSVSGAFSVIYQDTTKPEISTEIESGVYYVGSSPIAIKIPLVVQDENLEKVQYAWTKEDIEPGNYTEIETVSDNLEVTINATKQDIGSWYLWVEATDSFENTRVAKFGAYTILDAIESVKIDTEQHSCIESMIIKDDRRYLVVGLETPVEELKKYIITDKELLIVDEQKGKELTDEDTLKTNNVIMIPDIGDAEAQYTIVVKGDINADGKVNTSDVLKLNKFRNKATELSQAEKIAGDIVQNGKIDLSDVLKLNAYRLGKIQNL